jgi:hypothetical protein
MDESLDTDTGGVVYRPQKSSAALAIVAWMFPDTDYIVIGGTDVTNPISEDIVRVYNGVTFTWVKATRTLTMDRPVRFITLAWSTSASYIGDVLQTVIATVDTSPQSRDWTATAIAPETPPYTSLIDDAGSGVTGLIRKSDLKRFDDATTTFLYDTEDEWVNGHIGKVMPDGTVIDLPSWQNLPVGATAIKSYLYNDDLTVLDSYPDEANRETINRINITPATGTSDAQGSWTVDRDGYVACNGTLIAAGNSNVAFKINGKIWSHVGNAAMWTVLDDTLKVKAGDVVTIYLNTSTGDAFSGVSSSCYWMPAIYKAVPASNLQVEVGSDYSTTEQPVMVMDAVTKQIRQKLDVDGSPIWERTFTGVVNTSANTIVGYAILSSVKTIIQAFGKYTISSGYQLLIPNYTPNSFNAPTSTNVDAANVSINPSGNLSLGFISNNALTNQPYRVTVQYTKL